MPGENEKLGPLLKSHPKSPDSDNRELNKYRVFLHSGSSTRGSCVTTQTTFPRAGLLITQWIIQQWTWRKDTTWRYRLRNQKCYMWSLKSWESMEHIQKRKPRVGPRKFAHPGKVKTVKVTKSSAQDFSGGSFKTMFSVLAVQIRPLVCGLRSTCLVMVRTWKRNQKHTHTHTILECQNQKKRKQPAF